MKRSLQTNSPRLLAWARRIEEFLHKTVPGIETQIIRGPNYDEFSPHRTSLHVRYVLPAPETDWDEATEGVFELVTDANVETGRMIYVMPGLLRAEAQKESA